jgi:ABC-type sugar transport system permease subunit
MSRTVSYLRYGSIFVTVLFIGLLVLILIGIISSVVEPLWDSTFYLQSWVSSARQTLLYSLGATSIQFIAGTSAAWTLFYLRNTGVMAWSLEAVILSAMMAIYCMQPMLVWYICIDLLGLPDQALWSLIVATGWQYSPFVAFFTLLTFKAAPDVQHELCSLESAWNPRRVYMIFFPAVATAALSVTCIRFAWNATKFELPYRFQRGSVVASENVLAIRLSQETQFRAQLLWGLVLVLLVVSVVGSFLVLKKAISVKVQNRTRTSRSNRVGSAGPPALLHVFTWLGAACLLLYLGSFGFVAYHLLRVPSEDLQIAWQPIVTSTVFASISAVFATGVSLVVVFSYSRMKSRLTSAWAIAAYAIVAIPLVLIGALAYNFTRHPHIEVVTASLARLPLLSQFSYVTLLTGVRLIPALFAYVLFLTPLIFPMIHLHYMRYLPVEREELPQVDGRSRGLRLFVHAVFPSLLPILGLTTFLGFSIVLQDLAVAKWFVEGDLKLLSYELISLERSDTSGFTDLVRWSFLISLLQGLVFFGVYIFLPSGGRRR